MEKPDLSNLMTVMNFYAMANFDNTELKDVIFKWLGVLYKTEKYINALEKKRGENTVESDSKLGLCDVSTRLSFEEIGELADKWLEDEIAKDPQDQFTDREKYWMLEGFIEGYKKAQNGC